MATIPSKVQMQPMCPVWRCGAVVNSEVDLGRACNEGHRRSGSLDRILSAASNWLSGARLACEPASEPSKLAGVCLILAFKLRPRRDADTWGAPL
jgi:hypothetical protein